MAESDVLVLPVTAANVLGRSENVSASQTPSGTFPIAHLWDARGAKRFIFPLNQEDEEILVEAQIVTGGRFNTWVDGLPVGWKGATTGTGAITQETVSPLVDGSSVELTNGASGTAEISKDITVIAGEVLDLRVWTQTSNADSPAEVEIQCLETGEYLQSNFEWVPRQVNVGEFTQTSFGQRTPGKVTVPDFDEVGGRHTATLRVRLHMDAAAATRTVHFDDFFLIPPIDFASIHSHNIEQRITPRLSSSDEFSLSTVEVDSATRFGGASNLSRASELAGMADTPRGTISFWVEFEGGDGVLQYVISNGGNFFFIRKLVSNLLEIQAFDSGAVTKLLLTSTVTLTANGTRHHVLASWDVDNALGHLWIDDADALAGGATIVAGNIDYTRGSWVVGSADAGANKINGQLSDIWFYPGVYVSIPTLAKRRRFITGSGRSAILGAKGENPIGSSPHIFLANNAATFPTNLSGAGDFSVVGSALGSPIDLEHEFDPTSPAFYGQLSSVRHRRFWRMHFRGQQSGDDSNSIAPGEFILGNPKKLLRNPAQPRDIKVEQIPLIQQDTNVNEPYRVKRETLPQRAYRMRFGHRDSHQKRLADEIYRRTGSGAEPAVLVRDTQKTDVILGSTESNEIRETRTSFDRVETELVFRELSHGVLTG